MNKNRLTERGGTAKRMTGRTCARPTSKVLVVPPDRRRNRNSNDSLTSGNKNAPRGVDIAEMVKHPAYQWIIEMGEPAIGWLLERLSDKPGHWFSALNRITDANPVSEENQGNPKEMADAWLSWGTLHGYKRKPMH